ncbi:MAG: Ribonuclease Y [bacterium ADurb.Bin243]|nr:MAG: Ribonuclease Y [bacterium ADurb.Bin243]
MPDNFYGKFSSFFNRISGAHKARAEMVKGQTRLPDAQTASGFAGIKLFDALYWLFFFALLVFLLASKSNVPKNLPKIDEFAKYDIVAPYSIKLIDEAKTQAIKEEVIKSVPVKYKFDDTILVSMLKNIEEIFVFIKNCRAENQKAPLNDEEIEKKIQNVKISFNAFKAALETTDEILAKAKISLDRIIKNVMAEEVSSERIAEATSEAAKKIKMSPFNEKIQQMMLDIFEQNIKPNYIYDKQATQKIRNKLLADAIAVERHIKAGQIIVRRGEIIQKEHLDILNKFNVSETGRYAAYSYISASLIALFSIIVVVIYLVQNHEDIFKQKSLLTMMALIVLAIVAIARIVDFLSPERQAAAVLSTHESPFFSPFIVPVSAAAILIALLLDPRLAFIVNIITVILVDIVLGHSSLNFLIINMLSGTIAVLNVKNVNHRTDITKAGIMVSFTNVFLIISYAILEYNTANVNYQSGIVNDVIWGFFNGFISAIFAIGLLPYLESLFKVSSSMRLLELSDLNQPLLRRLLLEAPGTYHHCIIVGNLAEAAAKDIEADALLCRVGAYYHDIGKLKRPGFFIENQTCGSNIHDNIKPNLSAKSIMSHTKDGYEIGLEYQLPQEILDIIIQHHGTNLITYFYSKALESSDKGMKEELLEGEYRYLGPKPQTKEAAIILLADAVEAAFRTLTKPSPSAVESLVKKIKNERFNDGQFDECDITLKDLEKISLTLIRIINGMYHSRIEYPDSDKIGHKNKQGQTPEARDAAVNKTAAEAPLAVEKQPGQADVCVTASGGEGCCSLSETIVNPAAGSEKKEN